MSQFQNYKLKPEKFLTMATNVLYKTLVDCQRTDAKKVFNALAEGKRVQLLTVRLEDETDIRFDVSLDQSEFRGGRLNFKHFRDSVTGLVGMLSQSLGSDTRLPVFTERTDGSLLFAIPGLTQEDGQLNVMMLATNMRTPGTVLLKLQYLDPDQFQLEQNAS